MGIQPDEKTDSPELPVILENQQIKNDEPNENSAI